MSLWWMIPFFFFFTIDINDLQERQQQLKYRRYKLSLKVRRLVWFYTTIKNRMTKMRRQQIPPSSLCIISRWTRCPSCAWNATGAHHLVSCFKFGQDMHTLNSHSPKIHRGSLSSLSVSNTFDETHYGMPWGSHEWHMNPSCGETEALTQERDGAMTSERAVITALSWVQFLSLVQTLASSIIPNLCPACSKECGFFFDAMNFPPT